MRATFEKIQEPKNGRKKENEKEVMNRKMYKKRFKK